MRGKLENGVLIYAPNTIVDTETNTKYSPATDEILAKLGWKVIVTTNAPTCDKNYHAEPYWTETETEIVQVWNTVEDDPAMKVANLRNWFDNKYRMYNEMLTRYQALSIQETIEDDFREKTYTNLMELYTEAEVVRAEINELENEELID